jgi:HAD superfamily hydrolase (TIGR01509 family)
VSINQAVTGVVPARPGQVAVGAPFAAQLAGFLVFCGHLRDENGRRVPGSGLGLSFREAGMERPTGVLLDVDGTLVDSNDAHAHAWVKALAEAGVRTEFAAVRRLIGKGGDKLLPEVSGIDAESPKGKSISDRRGEIFRTEYLPNLKPLPGARELLARMKKAGLELAVASSSKKDELNGLLKVCGADEFIKASTSSDDAENSKPDPDIVHAALDRLGHPPGRVILLGDTPYDVEASRKAGVRMIALRCGGWGDADLGGAVSVYDDPADLLARFDESPFGGSG